MGLITATRAIELQPTLEAFTMAEIEATINAVSTFVENYCGRIFSQTTVVDEVIRTDQFGYHFLSRTPITSGSVTLKTYENQTLEAWILNTNSGELYCPSFPDQYLKVSYQGGYASAPSGLEVAVASMTLRACERLRRATGIASSQIGTVKTDFVTDSGFNDLLDSSIKALLSPFVRVGV